MPRADPVMRSRQPGLEIGEDEMADGQELLGDFRVAAFSDGAMIVAALAQVCVAAPIVRDDQRPLRHGALDEAAKRLRASVGGDGEPNAPGVAPVLARVLRGSGRAAAHLDGAGDESFVMNAPAFPARAAADPCLINLDMLVCATANVIPIGANHSGAQLVEELKGGLVAREAELPLELDRGYAGSLAGDEIGGPKPDGQRRAAALHDRADSQSCLASALAACQHARTARNAERFAVRVAARADEAALPARLLEICGAGRIVGEEPLKLRQRPGIRQRRALLHIHHNGRRRSHRPIQPRRKALAERDRRPAGPPLLTTH